MTRRSYLQHTTIRRLDSHARRVEIACKDAGCQFYNLREREKRREEKRREEKRREEKRREEKRRENEAGKNE